ncbi:hypothetical protein V2J09_003636 [Rumex salicifolius]
MLVAWILNTIEPSLRSMLTYMENAKELCDDISEIFSVVNENMGGFSLIRSCSRVNCGLCTCDVGGRSAKRREEEKIHSFFMGLDDAVYRTAWSAILAMDPLPSMNKICSTLIQEEPVNTSVRNGEEKSEMAFHGSR